MPMPLWWGQINKRVMNPRALENGKWPVLRHVGRSSGRTYRTPIGAQRGDEHFAFLVVYGPESDWVQNVIEAGEATLEVDGEDVALTNPRLVATEDAFSRLPADTARPPRFPRIPSCLEMDIA